MIVQINAYQILLKVILKQGHCNVLLAKMMQNQAFSEPEKTLIQELVIGTLKQQIYLEYILNNIFAELTQKEALPFALIIYCWIVLYQIYFDKWENKTIFIEETLAVIKMINAQFITFMANFLNYCFTNFKNEFNLPKEKSINIKLIKYSYPQWLYVLIQSQFSDNIAKALMKDNVKYPVTSFRVNTLKVTVDQVLTNCHYQDYHFQLSTIVPDGIISSKTIFNTELYQTGKIIKQDQASMLASHILNPHPDDLVLDMCAGIGSKTAHIAALMANHGTITAVDINKNRLKIAEQYFKKLGLTNVTIIVGNSITCDFNHEFDKILIDAPSTASGLIKRKPEVKLINWTKAQINELIATQAALLARAYQLLKPQGILVYVTSTFNIKENQNQIENFIKKHPKMTIIEEKQIFGFQEKTDGIYICKLKKDY